MKEEFVPTSGETVECAVCGENTALEESESNIISWMCVNCGYASNTLYKKNSITFRIYWILTVINMPSRGLIFPEGSKSQIIWTYIPIVDIPEDEQKNYPITNQNNKFYKQKLDPTKSKKFTRFYDALKEMGAIIQVDKLENPIIN